MELTTAPKLFHFEAGQIGPQADGRTQPAPVCPVGVLGAAVCHGEAEAPPSSNTGVQITKENAAVGIDWLQGTFKELTLEQVLSRFSPGGDWVSGRWEGLPCGRFGYRYGFVRGAIRVYSEGAEGMGIHVVCSGEGVRQIEAEGIVTGWGGPDGFAATLLADGFTASRVDGALDDFAGLVKPELVEQVVRSGGCVMRFNEVQFLESLKGDTGTSAGWTAYFGSARSDARVRIYDKAAEQASKGAQVEAASWVRVELQLRRERAQELLTLIAQGEEELSQVIAGRIWAYLDFRHVDAHDTNKTRWASCAWWSTFMQNAVKVRWKGAEVFKTVESTARWFLKQVAPSLALLMFSKQHGPEWIDEAFSNGAQRLREWQLGALASQSKAVTWVT